MICQIVDKVRRLILTFDPSDLWLIGMSINIIKIVWQNYNIHQLQN